MFKPPTQSVWIAYFTHTLIVLAALLLANQFPPHEPLGFVNPSIDPTPLLGKFIKWDAHWYTYVADHGYNNQSIVFFPLIILLIKALSLTGLSYGSSGLLVCNLFAFLSFWIMDLTLRLDFSTPKVNQALLSYAVLPTSFFLNSIYTEPLFIVFSLSCLYFTRLDQWWYAGIAGALATLTRNIGILLLIFLLYEFFKTHHANTCIKSAILPLLLLPAALLAFMVYNVLLLGDPLAFVHSQQAWGRHYGLPWENFLDNLPYTFVINPYNQPGIALDSIMVFFCFLSLSCLTFINRFKITRSYLILGWLWFIVPLFSTAKWLPLFSMSRFILVIFPLYIFLGQLPRRLFQGYLAVSTVTLLLCTALFLNWYWIG